MSKLRCLLLWPRWEVQITQSLAWTQEPSPELLTLRTQEPSQSSQFWICLGTCPALPRKTHYVNNKPFHALLVCVCVVIGLSIQTKFGVRGSIWGVPTTLVIKFHQNQASALVAFSSYKSNHSQRAMLIVLKPAASFSLCLAHTPIPQFNGSRLEPSVAIHLSGNATPFLLSFLLSWLPLSRNNT